MKLYYVVVMDDTEECIEVVVASSKEEAEERISNIEQWDCLMWAHAYEIDIVDGFKVKLEKI